MPRRGKVGKAGAGEPDAGKPDDGGRGLVALTVVLLLFSSLPLLADRLPPGPAVLVSARSAAVASAGAVLLFVLALWPALGRRGRPGAMAVQGVLYLLVGATFVLVNARSAETPPTAPWWASLVLAATTVVVGIHLLGKSADHSGDRIYATVVLFFCAGLPLANYALNEFGGISGRLGYRLSPPLLVRRILLGHADADPVPYFILCLLLAALIQGRRLLSGRASAALVFVLMAGVARGEEVRVVPLLGDAYVPGRVLPVLVTGTLPDFPPEVLVPDVATVRGTPRANGAVLYLPAPQDLGLVHVAARDVKNPGGRPAYEERELMVHSVPFGWRLVVSFTAVDDEFLDQAQLRSILITRAHPEAANLPATDLALVLLSADSVLDPAGVVPEEVAGRLRAAGVPVLGEPTVRALETIGGGSHVLRRVWEEEDSVLAPTGLFDLFPPEPAADAKRSRTAILVLFGYALLLLAGVRFALRRGLHPLIALALALVVSGWTVTLAVEVLPRPADWESRSVTAREGERAVDITLVKARQNGTAELDGTMVLGRGGMPVITAGRIRLPLRVHESRIAVQERFGAPELPESRFPDVLFGPAGLRRPGEEALPATEFLQKHYPGRPGRPNPRALLLRKLIRLADPPPREVGIRFPTAERPFLDVRPAME